MESFLMTKPNVFFALLLSAAFSLPAVSFGAAVRGSTPEERATKAAVEKFTQDVRTTVEKSNNVCGAPGTIVTVKIVRHVRVAGKGDMPTFEDKEEAVKVYGVTQSAFGRSEVMDSETCAE
jgi:hypothetical protein